jgi:GNAT superfamily N-acetyltransferase
MDLPTPTFRPADRVPSADASVRAATAADAGAMGRVQAVAWRSSYGDVLPADTLAGLEPERLGDVWRDAVVRPPSGAHRVLVALAAGELVGFAAIGPSEGPQPEVGELVALVVAPGAQHAGHGSRLLNAAADRLRDVGFEQVVAWVLAGDEVRLRFLTAAGFALDGAERTFAAASGDRADGVDGADGADAESGDSGDGTAELREVRLVASLAPPA